MSFLKKIEAAKLEEAKKPSFRQTVEAKYSIVDTVKEMAKKAAKVAFSSLIALGLLTSNAFGKDVSKKLHQFEKGVNKILTEEGASISCKSKDLGGSGYALRCTITDSDGKKANVDLVETDGSFSDVELHGDRNSSAMEYGKALYETFAKNLKI